MYQTALAHVHMLCSSEGRGYTGKPILQNLDKDGNDRKRFVRLRIFWYAFAHEGLNMGLKGGLLQLDDESEDMLLIEELAAKQGTGQSPEFLHATNKMLMAPINLAVSIYSATGVVSVLTRSSSFVVVCIRSSLDRKLAAQNVSYLTTCTKFGMRWTTRSTSLTPFAVRPPRRPIAARKRCTGMPIPG